MRTNLSKSHKNAKNGIRVYVRAPIDKSKFTTIRIARAELEELEELAGDRSTLNEVIRQISFKVKLKVKLSRAFGGWSSILISEAKKYLREHPEIKENNLEFQRINNMYWDKVIEKFEIK